MRNMYNFQSELWLIKSLKTAACKEREAEKEAERERERKRKGGERHTEIVQLVAQSVHSLFIQFLSV